MAWERPGSKSFRSARGLVAVLCGIAGFAFLMWLFPNCDANSRQARMAKSLPPERLAELYAMMAEMRAALPADERELMRRDLWQEQIPVQSEHG
jgi:hypothetical protein